MAAKAYYTLALIKTGDEKLVKKADDIRAKYHVTHEKIYRRGLEAIETNDLIKRDNVKK